MDKADFMRRAIELSAESKRKSGDQPFGAVVGKDGKILGEGRNRIRSLIDPTAHSEVVAIRAAAANLGSGNLSGCEIYTSCEPCPMCWMAIRYARIDRVHYGCSAATASQMGFGHGSLPQEVARPIGERGVPAEPMMTAEAVAALEAWLNPIG